MTFISAFIFAVEGAGLADSVCVISDGQLSGLVNKCMVVGEVAPEAALGGPLALVQDGDHIIIDVDAQTVDLDVPADALADRTPWTRTVDPELKHSWLGIYADEVGPSATGLAFSTRAGGGSQ
jgi:dihydroxy-acid dehydratase